MSIHLNLFSQALLISTIYISLKVISYDAAFFSQSSLTLLLVSSTVEYYVLLCWTRKLIHEPTISQQFNFMIINEEEASTKETFNFCPKLTMMF